MEVVIPGSGSTTTTSEAAGGQTLRCETCTGTKWFCQNIVDPVSRCRLASTEHDIEHRCRCKAHCCQCAARNSCGTAADERSCAAKATEVGPARGLQSGNRHSTISS